MLFPSLGNHTILHTPLLWLVLRISQVSSVIPLSVHLLLYPHPLEPLTSSHRCLVQADSMLCRHQMIHLPMQNEDFAIKGLRPRSTQLISTGSTTWNYHLEVPPTYYLGISGIYIQARKLTEIHMLPAWIKSSLPRTKTYCASSGPP